jgi:hypothetical protein
LNPPLLLAGCQQQCILTSKKYTTKKDVACKEWKFYFVISFMRENIVGGDANL